MIRHGSSFFISLIFHTILFVGVIFAWENMPSLKQKPKEKKVCVKLKNIVEEKPKPKIVQAPKPIIKPKPKPVPKKIVKPKPKPKKIIKPKPKPKPKKVVKPKPKPKPVPKKIEPVKEVPVVAPVVKEEPKIIEPEIIKEPEPIIEPEIIYEEPIQEPQEEVVTEEMIQERITQDYLDENIAKIVELLNENLNYPRSARRRGVVGEVMVKFSINTDGEAYDINILSSNSDVLSRGAKKTIESISGDFPKPKQILHITVPIKYNLK